MGFEPTEGCPSHAFQACRFGRSRTSPNCALARYRRVACDRSRTSGPGGRGDGRVCATGARESGQARKGAAFSGIARAPRSPGRRLSRRGLCACLVTYPRNGRRPSAGTVPRRPAWKSSNACCSSARLFITNGPYFATGSRIGSPPST